MKQILAIIGLLTASFLASSFTIIDQNIDDHKRWNKLGSKKVSFKLDKDIIQVGFKEGRYNKLKVGVTGGNLNMHKMKVVYLNGQVEQIALRHNFSKKSASRTIDVKGKNRIIKEIIFWYDTKNRSKNKATVHVYGRH